MGGNRPIGLISLDGAGWDGLKQSPSCSGIPRLSDRSRAEPGGYKHIMFEALAGQYFDRAFRKMVAAFETRAEELYGKRSSSAQSVA